MTPPRRIGDKRDYPLHAPPQRHHPDPAAPRDQIRNLPNTAAQPRAVPDAGDISAPQTVSNDHAAAVASAIEAQKTQPSHPSMTQPKGA